MTWDIRRGTTSIGEAVLPGVTLERGAKASRTGVSPQAGRMSMTLDRDELVITDTAQFLDDDTALWQGTVRNVEQSFDRSLNALRWSARASGVIADIVAARAGAFTQVYESITIDAAMNHVLDAIGLPAARRSIGISQRTLAWWWLPANVAPWRALLELMWTDGPTARLFENSSGQLQFIASRTGTTSAERTLYGRLSGTGARPIITLLDREDDGLDRVINAVDIPYARRPALGESSVGDVDWGTYDLSEALDSTARAAASAAAIGDRVLAFSAHAAFASGATANPQARTPDGLQSLYESQQSQALGSTTNHQQDVNVSTAESSVGERSGGTTLVNHQQDVTIRTGASTVTYEGITYNVRGARELLRRQSLGSSLFGRRFPSTMPSSATINQGGAGTGNVTIPSNAVNVRATIHAVTRYEIDAVGRSVRVSDYREFYLDFEREVRTTADRPVISRNANVVTATPPNAGTTFTTIQRHDVKAYEYDVTVRVSWQLSTNLPVTGWRSRFALATDPNTLPVGAAATQWRRVQGTGGSGMATIPAGATNVRVTITALSRRWVRYSSVTAANRASTTKGSQNVLASASSHVTVKRSGNTITVTPVARAGTTAYQSPTNVVAAGVVSSYVATVRVQWQQSTQPRTWSQLTVTHGTAPVPAVTAQTEYTSDSEATRRSTTNLAMLAIRNVADPRVVESGDAVGAGTVLVTALLVESRLDNPPRVTVGSGWDLVAGGPMLSAGTAVATGAGRVLFVATRRLGSAGTVPAAGWTLQAGTQPQNTQLRTVTLAMAVDLEEVWKSGEELDVAANQSLDVDVVTDGPIYDLIVPVEDFDYSVLSGSVTAVALRAASRPGSVIRLTAGEEGATVKGLRLRGVAVIGGLSVPARDAGSVTQYGLQHPASIGTWPWVDRATAESVANAWIANRARPLQAWDVVLDGDRNDETRFAALNSDVAAAIRTTLDDDFDRVGEVLAVKHAISNPAGNLRTVITMLQLSARPSRPTGLTLTAGDARIVARWTAAGGVTSYEIEWRATGAASWTSADGITGVTRTITGLTNDQEYEVRVRAVNAGSTSDWTPVERATPAAPTQVTAPPTPAAPVLALSSGFPRTAVVASWPVLANGGSAITRTRIRFRATGASAWTTVGITSLSVRTRTFQGLTQGTRYEAQLQATNRIGTSAWSASATITTQSSTVLPVAVAPAPTIAAVPSGREGTDVELSAALDGGTYDAVTYAWSVTGGALDDSTSATPTWTRPSVASDASYTISLTVTASGTGSDARAGTSDTASDTETSTVQSAASPPRPAAPTVGAGTPATTVIVATWPVLAAGSSPLSAINVRYRVVGAESWINTSVAISARSFTQRNLSRGTQYEVQIQASNSIGLSPWSPSGTHTTGSTTAPPKPSAPTLAQGADAPYSSIDVTWGVLLTGGRTITGVDVNFKGTAQGEQFWRGQTVSNAQQIARAFTITGLTIGTEYEVRLRAQNGDGHSPWSDSGVFTIPMRPVAVGPTVTIGAIADGAERTAVALSASLMGGTYDGITGYAWTATGGTFDDAAIAAPTWTRPAVSTDTDYTITLAVTVEGTGTIARADTDATSTGSATATVEEADPVAPPAPAAPVLSIGDAQLGVTWAAPAVGGLVTAITDYDVQYKLSSAAAWTAWPHTGAARTATITGLTNGMAYDVQVRATNSGGTSGWSPSASSTPVSTIAGPVITRTNRFGNFLILDWSYAIPAGKTLGPSGGAVNGVGSWVLELRNAADSAWVAWTSALRGTQRSGVLSGYTGRAFRLRANFTDGTESPWVEHAAIAASGETDGAGRRFIVLDGEPILLDRAPMAVRDTPAPAVPMVAYSVAGATIVISITPVNNASSYESRYSIRGAGFAGWTRTTATSIALEPNTAYYFQTRAIGPGGQSDWTFPIEVDTDA